MNHPKAPPSLSDEARRLWDAIHKEFVIERAADVAMLARAMAAYDLAVAAEKQLRRDGPVVQDRFGQDRAHPAASVARDARSQFASLLKQLEVCPTNLIKGAKTR